jgi:hypothetical protein
MELLMAIIDVHLLVVILTEDGNAQVKFFTQQSLQLNK